MNAVPHRVSTLRTLRKWLLAGIVAPSTLRKRSVVLRSVMRSNVAANRICGAYGASQRDRAIALRRATNGAGPEALEASPICREVLLTRSPIIGTQALAEIGHSPMPLLKVIRAKCLDCSYTASEVRRCTAIDCALWPYRLGINPFRAERSEAQKAAAIEAGRRLHGAKPTATDRRA
jgi:hypothetical protein